MSSILDTSVRAFDSILLTPEERQILAQGDIILARITNRHIDVPVVDSPQTESDIDFESLREIVTGLVEAFGCGSIDGLVEAEMDSERRDSLANYIRDVDNAVEALLDASAEDLSDAIKRVKEEQHYVSEFDLTDLVSNYKPDSELAGRIERLHDGLTQLADAVGVEGPRPC